MEFFLSVVPPIMFVVRQETTAARANQHVTVQRRAGAFRVIINHRRTSLARLLTPTAQKLSLQEALLQ